MKTRLLVISLFAFVCVNCSQKPPKSDDAFGVDNTNKEYDQKDISYDEQHFVPIDMKVISYDELGYRTEEKDGELFVTPTSVYYDRYVSKNRLDLTKDDYETSACPMLSYPIVELFIVNNTEESLNIDELDVEVSKSRLDDFPYLYFFKCDGLSYCLPIQNESWSNWGNMILNYRILRAGEKFNGTYDRKRTIPYFSDYMLIDFASDIRSMGLDESKLAPYIEYREEALGVYPRKCDIREGESDSDFNRYALFESEKFSYETLKELFYPFEVNTELGYGYAWLYGQVSFTKHSFKKDIKTQILITFPGLGGADVEIDDSFDIQLAVQKENYVKRLPYIANIAPHGCERVRINVRCDKSSHHDFIVRAKNNNGKEICTKPIHFYYINTPHSCIDESVDYD